MDLTAQSSDVSAPFDLSGVSSAAGGPLNATLTLAQPQTRLRLRLAAGEAGRADATLADGRRWAAKHHWREGDVVVYEFDEALPAGVVRLSIPFVARP